MIEFFLEGTNLSYDQVMPVESIIHRILNDFNYELAYENIIIMSDEELLEINKEFLNHDYFTDIITFNYADVPKRIESELYISWDRVKENANDNNVNELDELFRVIIHGTLHLVGFEDGTEVLKKDMQKHENQYLSLICST